MFLYDSREARRTSIVSKIYTSDQIQPNKNEDNWTSSHYIFRNLNSLLLIKICFSFESKIFRVCLLWWFSAMLHLNHVLWLLYVLASNKISVVLDINLGILLRIFPVNIFRRIFLGSVILTVENLLSKSKNSSQWCRLHSLWLQ